MKTYLSFLCLFCACAAGVSHAAQAVGSRPYEMVWANRDKDIYPPLVDFENLNGWKTETQNATVTFETSREQQLWDKYVGKLTYRANTSTASEIRLLPPAPIPVKVPWDALSCWIYGNTIRGQGGTPSVFVSAIFTDAKGSEVPIALSSVYWKEWFVPYRVLSDAEKRQLAGEVFFNGFRITGGTQLSDRVLYFDNFATFQDGKAPLQIPARPKRGIEMLPGESSGFNTGAGTLSFPNRKQTILPDNATKKFTARIRRDGSTLLFEYRGEDGNLTYRLQPKQGDWSDVQARWNDGAWFSPLVGGGVLLAVGEKALAPEKTTHHGTQLQGDEVISDWTVSAGDVSQDVRYVYRLQNKSLVIDTIARGGKVAEVTYGHAENLKSSRLVWNPFYAYNTLDDRPGIAVGGDAKNPLFLAGNTDWYLSNASQLWGKRALQNGKIFYNGGTRYIPKTDGVRNDCYERFFVTVAPAFEEVLPNIPNLKSPWMQVTGTRSWTARGASPDRKHDYDYFRKLHRYGIRNVVITDHETMWRDGEESFTFRTKTAPGKGGDRAQREYSRFLQDELGYVYGPYNNFTDFAPVNEFWSPDLIGRTPGDQLQTAWYRCYAPKPALAVDFAEKLTPINEEKFHFSTAYCDVHTAVSPWSRTDYDARVPGAGTFAATFYAYGEIMELQKKFWGGPVYSEGGHHWFYSGLTDGNYGQDQAAQLYKNPWLVDFDLRKIHPLNCNFGMGSPAMFWGRDNIPGGEAAMDQFFAATIAFGHTSFLLPLSNDPTLSLRSHFMLLALHSRYALANAQTIRYADAGGNLLETSRAVASGDFERNQIVTQYDDGTTTVVNGNADEWMRVQVGKRKIALPPFGYAGWNRDGKIEVFSGETDSHRADYSASPDYIFVDGRGSFTRFDKSAGNGPAVCRLTGKDLKPGEFEIIPLQNADCGFAITATSAVALDESGKELGTAQTRAARGLTYIVPVAGAFSYRVAGTPGAPARKLDSDTFKVLPGQKVVVHGGAQSSLQIPTTAKPGAHLWLQSGEDWIDFQVIDLTNAKISLAGNQLRVALQSNCDREATLKIRFDNQDRVLPLRVGQSGEVRFDLGAPTQRESRVVDITIREGDVTQTMQRVLLADEDFRVLAPLPEKWDSGMHLRGQSEQPLDAATGVQVVPRAGMSAGGVLKDGVFMHPPYHGGTGYAFLRYARQTLPREPVVFRASVGKQDGGYQGDGIWFKVAVIEGEKKTIVAEQIVKTFEWKPIEADLSPWAGKEIRIELMADAGPADNTEADWACWAEMRLESKNKIWQRRLNGDVERYRRAVAPFPAGRISRAELRAAKSGILHYRGLGVSGGTKQYAMTVELNGISTGYVAPAGGNEREGIFADAQIPLTPAAIAALDTVTTLTLNNPDKDYFAIKDFWIELELAEGRKISSQVSTAAFTQPAEWAYGFGFKIPFSEKIQTDIVF
jgi:hypothetical protein